jgi:plastocyanin
LGSLEVDLNKKFSAVSTVIVTVILIVIIVISGVAFFLVQKPGTTITTEGTGTSQVTAGNSSITSSAIIQSSNTTSSATITSATNSSSSAKASGELLPSFAFPGTLVVSPDLSSMNYSITFNSMGQVPNSLSLTVLAPNSLAASISPTNITFGSSAPTATLKLSSASNVTSGNYQIEIMASGSGQSYSENETVQVLKYLVVTIGTSFVPQNLTVTQGSAVTWIRLNGILSQYDNGAHDVDFSSGISVVSPTLNQYASWSYIFSQAGNYSYYCKYHPFMTGEIIVTS